MEGPFDPAVYGPPGTVWLFDEADMLAGLAGLPGNPSVAALNIALRKLGVTFGAGSLLGWRTPDPALQPPGGDPMRWIHATIIGKIGTTESVAHTLNFRTAPAADADQDAAALTTFAGQIRNAWVTFLTNGTSSTRVDGWLASSLTYTEVRAAYLEQTVPASVSTHQGKRGLVKDFHYPRPTYLVPTQYSTFAAGSAIGRGSSGDMPWEVACAVTMRTAKRGSRNRGRIYLGPLDRGIMATGGLFDPVKVKAISDAFGTFTNTLNTATGNRLHVVSRSYCTSEGVNGIQVGVVPDSQRRRRRSQTEQYGTVSAT